MQNPDELEPGRELDALVAQYIFGWIWYLHKGRGRVAIFPPENKDGWIRWNFFNSEDWEPLDEPGDHLRFTDWDRLASPARELGEEFGGFMPHFSTDIAAAWQVDRPVWQREFMEQIDGLHVFLFCGPSWPAIIVGWDECPDKAAAYALGRCRAALREILLSTVREQI